MRMAEGHAAFARKPASAGRSATLRRNASNISSVHSGAL